MEKVRIEIIDPRIYTSRAYEALNGKLGVVERWHETEHKALVRFDTPAPKFYEYGTPHTHFWIPSSDLKEVN